MSEKEDSAAPQPETHGFQADVARLLDLMVHSVYSDREVFLRELISNASDALDKLRYEALTDASLLGGENPLKITVSADPEARTLSVADSGIGMSRDDLVENLGTIAKSGTRAFLERASGENGAGASGQIGQFGVGFYAAFMVAGRVEVLSRKAGTDDAFLWRSDGEGDFSVEPADASTIERGSVVTLHLRDDAVEFLEPARLRHIVKAYSDHIAFPIEVGAAGAAAEVANSASALWMRPKQELGADDYAEFYRHATALPGEPWLTIHYRAEGRHEYAVLLFVPGEKPFDLFDPERSGRVKLYVRRVFITDEAGLLPGYLRFVRGVVDSEDMPLNLSREMLQNNPIVARIGEALTKRVLSELKKKADGDAEGFQSFWARFGQVLKEGLYEDPARREALFALTRFRSTLHKDETRTLAGYVADMPEAQKAIYYLTGDDPRSLASSPQLEGFKARGLEVLLLSDPVDAFWVSAGASFEERPFRSVEAAGADLDDFPLPGGEATGESTPETDDAALGTLLAAFKQTLEGEVADVRRSARLKESPVCLVGGDALIDRQLQKILAARAEGPELVPRILEVNPSHPLIRTLADEAKTGGMSDELAAAAWLLYDEARLMDGEAPSDRSQFASRLNAVLMARFGD